MFRKWKLPRFKKPSQKLKWQRLNTRQWLSLSQWSKQRLSKQPQKYAKFVKNRPPSNGLPNLPHRLKRQNLPLWWKKRQRRLPKSWSPSQPQWLSLLRS